MCVLFGVVKDVVTCCNCTGGCLLSYGRVSFPVCGVFSAQGVDVLADVVGGGGSTEAGQKAVEFEGVMNQVQALVGGKAGWEASTKYVVMCSSMGTTDPKPAPYEGGTALFWKLNAEAFLLSSGVPSAVVKPGGLMNAPCCQQTLRTGHNDDLLKTISPPVVARADVARVMKVSGGRPAYE